MKRTFIFVAIAILTANAHATLMGDEITADYFSEGNLIRHNQYIVGAGVEGDPWVGSLSLDVDDSSISLIADFQGFGNVSLNFSDLDWVGAPGTITGVDVVTDWGNWTSDRVTFGDDWINVDVSDTDFIGLSSSWIANISATHGVPTPATLALFGLGLAGLGWSRRKKA
jgi:hypothetical protein